MYSTSVSEIKCVYVCVYVKEVPIKSNWDITINEQKRSQINYLHMKFYSDVVKATLSVFTFRFIFLVWSSYADVLKTAALAVDVLTYIL